jgi:hypothetical protein
MTIYKADHFIVKCWIDLHINHWNWIFIFRIHILRLTKSIWTHNLPFFFNLDIMLDIHSTYIISLINSISSSHLILSFIWSIMFRIILCGGYLYGLKTSLIMNGWLIKLLFKLGISSKSQENSLYNVYPSDTIHFWKSFDKFALITMSVDLSSVLKLTSIEGS